MDSEDLQAIIAASAQAKATIILMRALQLAQTPPEVVSMCLAYALPKVSGETLAKMLRERLSENQMLALRRAGIVFIDRHEIKRP